MQFTHEHREIQKTLKRFIDEQIKVYEPRRVDAALEPWRDRRGVDRVFHWASEVGDFGLVGDDDDVAVGRNLGVLEVPGFAEEDQAVPRGNALV